MALVFGVLFAVALLLLLKCLTGRKRRPGEPPVVQGWIPFIGQTIEFGRDSHGFLLSCQRKLGDVFTVYIAGKYVTFILDPFLFHLISQLGKQIDFQEFSLGLAAKVFGFPILNDPKIPISNEEIHKLYHYLKGDELNILIRSTTENLQNIMRRDLVRSTEWRIEYMYDFCCRIIFEATYVSLYGKAPINEEKKITELKEKFIKFDQMFPYLAASIPIELLGNTKRIHKELISYLTSKELDQRLCMAKLIQGRRDLFDRYPYLQDDQKAGSAIDEAFRLGSSSMNIRFVKEDVNINFKEEKEIKLRKGDLTAIYPQILHMDPEVFEDPEVYKYDRFIENGMKKTTFYKGGKKLRNYLMPFGSGASKCPGRYFAVSEIKMFISLILTAFDLEIIHQERPVMPSKSRVGLGVLHPESDVQFRYKLRQ
ncbi:cytochrome P450 7B1 isoform X2 [Hypanus sabinus]|uniref:cytochrome P450 7B1 isoform X2 n=1 Tax=Hypanus sabinus TaxID=79690 RepID=UPI0028C38F6A|nr:cytochrome P450 7B1 isoform X2 [Hypanus sabinus]